MPYKSAPSSSLLLVATFIVAVASGFCCHAQGQVFNRDQEISAHNLPLLTAHSQDPSDILVTSLETVFHDQEVCCAKNSALGDSARDADAKSLKDVAEKLDGRHLLPDGQPIKVTAEYVAADRISGAGLISMILHEHAALVQWNSHLYVLHDAVYRWIESGDLTSGLSSTTVIHKLLLWDPRFADSRRDLVLDRATDELSKLQGLLFLESAPQ
jgi:hypothetical protein